MRYQLPKIQTKIVREGVYPSEIGEIHRVEDVVTLMADIYEGADREMVYALCLDAKGKVISIECVTVGTLNACLVTARELFKSAILCNAAQVLMVHNHPSEEPEPSQEDEKITEQFYHAGNLLGIGLTDHVIFGNRKRYYSFRESGFFHTVQQPYGYQEGVVSK